jgi:hypothetical protein
MRHGEDGFTSLAKEGMLRNFSPEKIRRLRPSLNPRTRVPEASMLTTGLPKPLQLIGTIERTILRKVRTETILKLYNTLVLPTFLYGSENWILTASQRLRIEAAEMKLSRSTAGHAVNNHKTNDSIRRELQTKCILDKIDEYRRNWLLHLQRMPQH